MDFESEWNKFIARTDNFHWDSKKVKIDLTNNEVLYKKIYDASRHLFTSIGTLDSQKKKELLHALFKEAYTVITMGIFEFAYFLIGAPLYNNAYKACFFTSLCIYLHETTRIKGSTLKEFIYNNSVDYYNDVNLKHFCPFDNPSDELLKDVGTLRQQRYRLFSSRPVYNIRPEWSAMAKDSEYEWRFKYTLDVEDDTLYDTYKRIGNLYNDINNALSSPPGDGFEETIRKAYNKFISKINKIKYENYIQLIEKAFDHICDNEKDYGINLYRIEKTLRPYITSKEVNQLLACESAGDKEYILNKSVILYNIWFPKVYDDLASLNFISDIENYSFRFFALLDFITPISCLLIDELIENNGLGENWEDFLHQIINELAKEVFYDLDEINYTVTSKSQEAFMKILSATVKKVIYEKTNTII